jgi:hypothetical protein
VMFVVAREIKECESDSPIGEWRTQDR